MLKTARFEDAAHQIKTLQTQLPAAQWIARLSEQTDQTVVAIREIQASPFALLDDLDTTSSANRN
jgi:hypothetical protein